MADSFTWNPDFGCEADHKPSTRVTKFNDGYEQRLNYGLNTDPENWNLSFSLREDTEATAIKAFFQAHVGVAFSWVTPDGDTFLFVYRDYKKKKEKFNLNTITVTFEQVFES